jgi:metallophosphoesterase superfamily enzyme
MPKIKKEPSEVKNSQQSNNNVNSKHVELISSTIKTLNDLIKECNIDLKIWIIKSYKQKYWGNEKNPNYYVSADLVKKIPDEIAFPTIQPINVVIPKYTKPQLIKSDLNKALIIQDIHFGYKKNHSDNSLSSMHDERILDIALQLIKSEKPNKIILNGDILDVPDFSSHFAKSPEVFFTMQPTLIRLNEWLGEIRSITNAEIIYLQGNHEERLVRFVNENVAFAYNLLDKTGSDILSLPSLIDFENLGITFINGYPNISNYWLNDNLQVVHGDKARKTSGDTAKEYLKTIRHSLIFAHSHRQELVEKTLEAKRGNITYSAVNFGCACRLTGIVPGSTVKSDWQNGLGITFYEKENGGFSHNVISIHNGRCIYNGKIYEGKDR